MATALVLFARGESIARKSRRREVDQAVRQPKTTRVLAGSLHFILACPQDIILAEIDLVEPLTREARRSPLTKSARRATGTRSLLPAVHPQLDDGEKVGFSLETMRMRGPDCRSLVAVVKPGPQRQVRATAAIDVQASIAIVVRSSAAMAEASCELIDPQKPARPLIEHVQRVAHGPRTDLPGQQIIPGDVKAAYQRRPRTEDTHQLDLLV